MPIDLKQTRLPGFGVRYSLRPSLSIRAQSDAEAEAHRGGAGMPSWRQIACAVPNGISR
jgi:hypothetical protein